MTRRAACCLKSSDIFEYSEDVNSSGTDESLDHCEPKPLVDYSTMSAQVEADVQTISPEMPAMFDGMKLAAVATVLYVIVRILNLKCPMVAPDITCQDNPLNCYLLKSCPILTKEYIPPLLWGKSGHLQTALYGKMGRVKCPKPCGLRKYLPMSDGATATFDLFEPQGVHCTGDEITMVICPGIGNHSEKHYIRTFVDYSQKQGYRCAVLNHLGALPNIELTSPRMFTYGCTWEFSAMMGYIKHTFPQTQLIVVGFSLGGNIACKYLGENLANQERVLCCVSVCQGYNVLRAQETFLQWDQCRRLYNFIMAGNMKKIILSHRASLFGMSSSKMEPADLSRLYTATSLMQIDDNIMRKFHGHNSIKEYYEKESCVHYIHNISVPLFLMNSSDDPLVHQSLLTIPRTLAASFLDGQSHSQLRQRYLPMGETQAAMPVGKIMLCATLSITLYGVLSIELRLDDGF
ncbi:monoacylglycerol lipase ABHD2-like isoform X2 [Carassius carassius]|uniref:monoacylglycerol lipase ABHD2-like isoform X2 n=1 Tax=Carassius carassius TaxID=217509 RepID=UPI0028686313|nr:monoacylglycerol lipase ABHD2-like isoform X2 [Carassius carassius]